MKAESMANKLRSKKVISFWREVKSLKCAKNRLALKIDDATAPAEIAHLFKNKFSSVLREIDDAACKSELYDEVGVAPLSRADFVSPEEVCLHAS